MKNPKRGSVSSVGSLDEKKRRRRRRKLQADICSQVEFYFSDPNLRKDRFLSQEIKKTPDGYVPLEMIASFNKIQSLTDDRKLLVKALNKSQLVEVSPCGTKLRRLKPLEEPKYDPDDCTVYVECLPKTADIEWLQKTFRYCGNVVYVSLPRYQSTRDIKGFAFVEYETPEEAARACQLLNNPLDDYGPPGLFPKTRKGRYISVATPAVDQSDQAWKKHGAMGDQGEHDQEHSHHRREHHDHSHQDHHRSDHSHHHHHHHHHEEQEEDVDTEKPGAHKDLKNEEHVTDTDMKEKDKKREKRKRKLNCSGSDSAVVEEAQIEGMKGESGKKKEEEDDLERNSSGKKGAKQNNKEKLDGGKKRKRKEADVGEIKGNDGERGGKEGEVADSKKQQKEECPDKSYDKEKVGKNSQNNKDENKTIVKDESVTEHDDSKKSRKQCKKPTEKTKSEDVKKQESLNNARGEEKNDSKKGLTKSSKSEDMSGKEQSGKDELAGAQSKDCESQEESSGGKGAKRKRKTRFSTGTGEDADNVGSGKESSQNKKRKQSEKSAEEGESKDNSKEGPSRKRKITGDGEVVMHKKGKHMKENLGETKDGDINKEEGDDIKKALKELRNTERVDDSENKKKKRIRQRKEKEEPQLFLRVLSKAEWLKLKEQYLHLQKIGLQDMKAKMREQWRGIIRESKKNEKLPAPSEEEQPKKNTIKFVEGVVVRIKSKEPISSRKTLREQLEAVEPVAYVDLQDGDAEGFVRFITRRGAETVVSHKFETLAGISFELIKGEEEKAYWDKLRADQENKLNSSTNKRKKKRGRQRLMDRTMKSSGLTSHTRFDEEA